MGLSPEVAEGQGYLYNPLAVELLSEPRMHERTGYELDNLPAELDWRSKDGRNYTTVSRNQHIPKFCGACYAFGSTTALSDRIKIAQGGVGAEVNLAMQVVLNCDKTDLGCNGGDALTVYQFIHEHGGIPDETCQPYEAVGHDTGRSCHAKDICSTCDANGCRAAPEYHVYGVAQYGRVRGLHPIMAELQRGPIACAIATPPDFISHPGWDIYEDKENKAQIDHIISVVGYGSENGKDYWILRNSWGTYWGYYGWARVARGINNIHIEEDCSWATPSNNGQGILKKAWKGEEDLAGDDKSSDESKSKSSDLFLSTHKKEKKEEDTACRVPSLDWEDVGGELVLTPRPHEEMSESELPASWDWRNVSGRSFVTWNTNEHLPRGQCASCWAQGVAATLGDRIAVMRDGAWPQVGLSAQVLLNCQAGGDCSGGDPAKAYNYVRQHGLTDETCQNYQAEEFSCKDVYICQNCAPEGEHHLSWPGTCVAVTQPIVYFVSQYGSVRGSFPMKAEIYKRGPIGCGLMATEGFKNYREGIYSEHRDHVTLNQQVSLAGWGQKDGTEFWVGRNSWGTYWGESGWFRLQMHRDNLGVESDCDWGVPTEGSQVPSTMLASSSAADEEDSEVREVKAAPPALDQRSSLFVMMSLALVAVATVAQVVAAGRRRTPENDDESFGYIRVD